MLIAAITCFGLAIILGLVMASYVLSNKPIPRAVSLTHGPLAISGIVLLILYSLSHQYAFMTVIVLFVLAAVGGLTMFYKDITGKQIPIPYVIGHGSLAFIAFMILVVMTAVSYNN